MHRLEEKQEMGGGVGAGVRAEAGDRAGEIQARGHSNLRRNAVFLDLPSTLQSPWSVSTNGGKHLQE